MIRCDAIAACRLCGDPGLALLYDFGDMVLTGRFPKSTAEPVPSAPVVLSRCAKCGLVQLGHDYDMNQLYRHTYGYRSGINEAMVRHLVSITRDIEETVELAPGDVVLDIGSNDGTLLATYRTAGLRRIGIDPTIAQFARYYPEDIIKEADFFSSDTFLRLSGGARARVITSIAMMYDLENPNQFVQQIRQVLAPEGLWIFEQSDLLSMIASGSFDTICHEHLEYYGVSQLQRLLERNGLRMFDVRKNDANGGSARIFACHDASAQPVQRDRIDAALREEVDLRDRPMDVFDRFFKEAESMRTDLRALLSKIKAEGKTTYLYGASTKGNVLLQFCGIGRELISATSERNPDKFGSFTPGTLIPIVSEEDARRAAPDYMLVLPWHFRDAFIAREAEYLEQGGRFVFPRPQVEIYPPV